MTSENFRSELERHPFSPLRIHLVSGKTVDILRPAQVQMLQNAVMVLPVLTTQDDDDRYDIIVLRNIERVERLGASWRNESQ